MNITDAVIAWKGNATLRATITIEDGSYVVKVDDVPLESTGSDHARALGIRQSLLLSSQEWELVG